MIDVLLVHKLKNTLKCDVLDSKECSKHYRVDKSYLNPEIPLAVVLVESNDDVKSVLDFANYYKVPVTVRGAGSGKSGGAIPEKDGIVISFEKMNQILEIDLENGCVVVEPGVVLDDIKEMARLNNLWYPVDPSSSDWCTVGGTISENAGGACSLKYGVTGDYVLSLEGYFGNGEFFCLGRKCYKDVAGYDVKRLLVGSEGTLAVVTKITLKLIPAPKYEKSMWCTFDSLEIACSFLQKMCRSSIWFSAAEFMEPLCLDAVNSYLKYDFFFSNGHAVLLRYDSDTEVGLDNAVSFVKTLCESVDYKGTFYVGDKSEFWLVRCSVSEALAFSYLNKFSEDITVPPGRVSEFLTHVKSFQTSSVKIVGYGHLGDGNIHTNLLNLNLPEAEWQKEKERLVYKLMDTCIQMGGTLSGEHGVGLTKKMYMPMYFSEFEISFMKGIKDILDPNRILNPSKIFG